MRKEDIASHVDDFKDSCRANNRKPKKMSSTIKRRWLKALRSGEYKQGTNYLANADEEYCCLGVLCDLHRESGEGYDWTKDKEHCDADGDEHMRWYYHDRDTMPPDKVNKWSGLDPLLGDQLAEINDAGATFKQLVEVIKDNA